MKKLLLIISLTLLTSFSAFAQDEIEDLQRAKVCFSMESNYDKLSKEIEPLKTTVASKEKANAEWKRKLDNELKTIKSQDPVDDKSLKKWETENKKFKVSEQELGGAKNILNSKKQEMETLAQNSNKLKCKGHFSEEAVEQICLIDKQYPLSCTRLLNGEMKNLKE